MKTREGLKNENVQREGTEIRKKIWADKVKALRGV